MTEANLHAQAGIAAPIDWFTPKWTSTFEEIKPYLKTGDILLVHGRYPGSWITKILQGSKWGHVAMIIKRTDLDPDNKLGLPELLLWESNTLMPGSVPNLWPKEPHHNQVKGGPMLIGMEARLAQNLKENPEIEYALKAFQCPYTLDFSGFPEFIDKHISKTFPDNDWKVFSSVLLGRRYNKIHPHPENIIKVDANEKESTIELLDVIPNKTHNLVGPGREHTVLRNEIYCSELIAETYKYMGLLTKQYVSNAYTPVDFSDESEVKLLRNAQWLPEIRFAVSS